MTDPSGEQAAVDLTPIRPERVLEWPPFLDELRARLAGHARAVYIVGGAVRDAYLRRPIHDLDFVTATDGRSVARRIADVFGGAYFTLDADRGIGRAIVDWDGQRYGVDVSNFRGPDLASDLRARDFTMNAMAVPLDGDPLLIIDPLGGLRDLKAKRLRRCSPTAFIDDPLRGLRAVRMANTLHLLIEPDTRADLRAAVPFLNTVSTERIRDEFLKILDANAPHAALRTLDTLGYLRQIVPETVAMHNVMQSPPHIYDVWEHTLKVIEALEIVYNIITPNRTDETAADGIYGMIVYRLDRYRKFLQAHIARDWPNDRTHKSLLILAALMHDCAKPLTRTVDAHGIAHFYGHEQIGADLTQERLSALRLSIDEMNYVSEIVRNHMRPVHFGINGGTVTRRGLYRFWKATGAAGVDVCILAQADYLGTYGHTVTLQPWLAHLETVAQLLEGYFFQKETAVAPPPLLNGNDLMQAFAIAPGPIIGRILRRLGEAQAVGDVATREQALELVQVVIDSPDDVAESSDDLE